MKGARLVLTPDRDAPGLKYISNFQRDFSSQIEGWYLAGTAGLWKKPAGGMDIGDDILDHQLTKEQIIAKIISCDAIGDYIDLEHEDILPDEEKENAELLQIKLGSLLEIKDKKAPQIFEGDLAKSLQTTANNFNITSEILVFCLLPILSARIPSETRLLINPGTDYSVPAIRWTALVGETGTKKSPILKVLLAPLLNIQKELDIKYKAEKNAYDKEYTLWKNKKGNDREEEPTPPAPMVDCYFSDFTIESIGQSISDRPQDSYLVFVDELAGFFNSMDAYRKGGGDRQKWLDLYAGALKINRKGSPTIFCPNTSVSIIGGLQPSVLAQMIEQDANVGDGLWNRFMFCSLSQTKTKAFSHNSISLFDCLFSLYTNLASTQPSQLSLGYATDNKNPSDSSNYQILKTVINGHHSAIGGNTVTTSGNSIKALSSKASSSPVTIVTTISSNKILKIGDRVRYVGNNKSLQNQYAGVLEIRELNSLQDEATCLKPTGGLTSWVQFEDLEKIPS